MNMILLVAQAIINGLLLGLVYTAMSIGLSLTLGIMGIVNVAHSVFSLLGAYLAFELFKRFGIDPVVAMAIALALFFAVGAVLERVLVRRVIRAPQTAGLLVLFGVLVAVEAAAILIWTNDTRAVSPSYAGSSLVIGDLTFSKTRLIAGGAALLVVSLLDWFLRNTLIGKGIRAMSQNRDAAMVMGIDVEWLSMLVFGLGTAMAAAGGVALALIFTFSPPEHMQWLAWAFLVVVVGGMGSIRNTLLAGLAIGLIQTTSALFMPFQYVYVLLYALLAIMLMVKGQGLGGLRGRVV